jgi:hypothetical protein
MQLAHIRHNARAYGKVRVHTLRAGFAALQLAGKQLLSEVHPQQVYQHTYVNTLQQFSGKRAMKHPVVRRHLTQTHSQTPVQVQIKEQ